MKLRTTTCSTVLAFLASLISPGTTYPTPSKPSHELTARNPSYVVDVVYEFPKGTWIENLAVRANDQILATILSAPEVYQIDPNGARAPALIHTFEDVTSVLGIAEVFPDIFCVATGSFSLTTFASTVGSFSVWSIDMNTYFGSSPATAKKVADIPEAILLNGVTTLNIPGLIVIADAGLGVLWRVNVVTGEVTKIIQDPTMTPGTIPPAVGINGVKIRNEALYFTNTNQETFVRIPIHPDGTAAGPAVILASGIAGLDDFTFDRSGDAFLALDAENELGLLPAKQTTPIVLAGSPSDNKTLAGPTACQFGRGKADKDSLYISSNGGIAGYLPSGVLAVGGRISRVDVGVRARGNVV